MAFLNRLKIGTRLILGFSILMLFVLMLGVVGNHYISKVWERTELMYRHPYAVSNAVREVEMRIFAMHRSMKDVSLAKNRTELQDASLMVDLYENEVFLQFDLIEERFLGDPKEILECREKFAGWRRIRNEVIEHTKIGENEIATAITRGKGADYVNELINSIAGLKVFANGKALEFYDDAGRFQRLSHYWVILILVTALIFSLLITVAIIRSITSPLRGFTSQIEAISEGDLRCEIQYVGKDELAILARRLQVMQDDLLQKLIVADKVTLGDYSIRINENSEKDELSIALNHMGQTLGTLHQTMEDENWIKTGINQLNEEMRGDKDVSNLSSDIIHLLAKYVGAQIGAIYLMSEDNKNLCLISSYAYIHRKGLKDKFARGEGLVGQSALDKEIISVTDVPDNYIVVGSGLGNVKPRNILLIPLIKDDGVLGVVELAAVTVFSDVVLRFLKEASEGVAIAIDSAKSRELLDRLLKETQQKSAELQSQQEELRVTNEELAKQTDLLLASEGRLQLQQEELATKNEELEDQNESLEKQKSEIDRKNSHLEESRRELEGQTRKLEIASKYKSEFLANMSHELRTPLNSLLILSKDLMNNSGGNLDSEQVESAGIIYKSGSDLLHLINDILDLSKIEAGKLTLHYEPLKLNLVCDDLIKRFRPLAKQKGLTLSVDRDDDLPESIITDPQRFTQILTNLLSNAVKFTAEGSIDVHLSRSAENPEEKIYIKVVDTGIGISEDMLLKIFESFQQADGSISRNFGGTGLGLSITRELSKLLEAEVQVESEPGVGSIFSLLVPVKPYLANGLGRNEAIIEPNAKTNRFTKMTSPEKKQSHIDAYKSVDDDRDHLDASGKTLLVIEDDESFALILKKMAKDRGFHFLHAPTGEQGMELVSKFQPSAIILDIYLPGIQGWEVLDSLKSDKDLRHIPVHMMSADSCSIDSMRKGAIGFSQKPLSPELLVEGFDKIEGIINKKIKDILIVEDDFNASNALADLIKGDYVSITQASSGQQALAFLEEKVFDCMILDMGLPDVSGVEFLRSLKSLDIGDLPPVIVHTGQDITEDQEYELREYAQSIIIKGVKSPERLLDETALFLHQVVENLPDDKRDVILNLHDTDRILEGKNVLIVDDDMRNVFALSTLLQGKNMNVFKAANGQKALDVLGGQSDVDIVLMDVMMPIMDGLEATKKIRENKNLKNIPIVCVTAKAMKEDRKKCLDAGANDYVTKPIDSERLISVMRVWLHQ